MIAFDVITPRGRTDPRSYLAGEWAQGAPLSGLETIDINGFPAATGTLRLNTNVGPRDARLVAIRSDQDRIARFAFFTPPNLTARMEPALQRTTFSFRPLTRSERSALRPRRLSVVTVRRGDTVSSLARRMAFDDFQVERFLALNGMDAGAPLQAGQRVKLIVQ